MWYFLCNFTEFLFINKKKPSSGSNITSIKIIFPFHYIIAHGTPDAKGPAANLLFYYWPSLNPTHYDRRTVLTKFNSSPTWTPPICQNPECISGNAGAPGEAVKVCLDHTISLAHKPEIPPPSFCCNDCYTQLVSFYNFLFYFSMGFF